MKKIVVSGNSWWVSELEKLGFESGKPAICDILVCDYTELSKCKGKANTLIVTPPYHTVEEARLSYLAGAKHYIAMVIDELLECLK